MSKIEEFEQALIRNGMTDQNFEEYKILLKRVRGNYAKRQHCYTTAIQFHQKDTDQAIKLIRFGVEIFPDGWFTTYSSYLYIGKLYEAIGAYQNAYDSYRSAGNVLGPDQQGYIDELSGHIMWMRLHIDQFHYSEELESLYQQNNQASSFSKGLINNEFNLTIAKLVISLHHNRTEEAREAYAQATAIHSPSYISKMQRILAKHKYTDALTVTPEAVKFLKKTKL